MGVLELLFKVFKAGKLQRIAIVSGTFLKSTRKSGNRPFQSDPRKPLSILFLLAEVPLQQALEGLAVTGFISSSQSRRESPEYARFPF